MTSQNLSLQQLPPHLLSCSTPVLSQETPLFPRPFSQLRLSKRRIIYCISACFRSFICNISLLIQTRTGYRKRKSDCVILFVSVHNLINILVAIVVHIKLHLFLSYSQEYTCLQAKQFTNGLKWALGITIHNVHRHKQFCKCMLRSTIMSETQSKKLGKYTKLKIQL